MQLNATVLAIYGKIIEASGLGANVKPYVYSFNEALNYSMQGKGANAMAILTIINSDLSRLIEGRIELIIVASILTAVIAVVLVVLVFMFRRRVSNVIVNLIAGAWLKLRGSDYVYLSSSSGEVGYVIGVVLGIIIVLGVFAYLSYEIPLWYQFEGIGVLTSSGFSNYPTSIAVGGNLTLYCIVYSHRVEPTWYLVYVELNGTITEVYSRLLTFNQTWLFPFTISLTRPGKYNITLALYLVQPNGNIKYTGRYVRLIVTTVPNK
ncbi:hypothetical protein [Caldivirga sp.]|uniref:hypothetical protein n=1 Tax=Caldivirga sp. TaxID=2080243 RepID=UPI003D096DD4